MNCAILSVLALFLVACERSSTPDLASSDTSNTSNTPPIMLSLLQRLPDGRLISANATVSPSLPCPKIQISKFDVENLRKDPTDDYGYVCDLLITGTLTAALCDMIPGASGVIKEARLFHNDGEKPIGSFPVQVEKTDSGHLARPFPFQGSFRFKAEGIAVTEGNNTFRVVSRDSVYGLDGHSLWAVSFAFPYEDEFEPDDEEGVKGPTVVKGPEIVGGGSGGELFLYCLALKSAPAAGGNMRLILDGGSSFAFKEIEGTGYSIPVWPGTDSPALFTLRPTMAIQAEAPSDATVISALDSNPALASLSPENRFLYGFSQGLGFEGYDLVFDSNHLVRSGVRLSMSHTTFQLSVGLADTGSRSLCGEAEVGADPTASPSPVPPGSMPGMFWHFASLFRTSDPRADEVVLALLLGDLAEAGLEEVSIGDWREYFYMCFAEVTEELIKETITETEAGQGYHLGRAVGDALRPHVDPALPGRIDEIGKAEFLSRLQKLPFFNPKGRARMALKKQAGLIGGLRRFMGRNG